MVPGSLFSTSRRRLSSPTTLGKPTITTFSSSILPIRVRLGSVPHPNNDSLTSGLWSPLLSRIFTNLSATEYKDDSQIIPRSTSVIVRRRPPVRPGKGRAAVYISGTPGASSEKPAPTVTPANNTWHRPGFASGLISKRFDSREKEKERDELQKPVRVVSYNKSGVRISFPPPFFFLPARS